MTTSRNGRERLGSRAWADEAVRRIEADANRSADTHLHVFPLPEDWGIDLYLKDESVHPTGSLKHRLARSLFLYGLCNGWITERTTIVEASSGSTAVSEAYFARFLGLPFVAVMPASTSPEKIALIEAQGGSCHLVDDPATVYDEAQRLAAERGGYFLDQFTYAERATDWRGNNNIAESIFSQMALERHPVPAWIVVGAGTGGTSATIGRYARFGRYPTRMCVVDPEDSIFYSAWTGDPSAFTGRPSRIEGIGRQRVEPSFLPGRRRPDDPGSGCRVDRDDAPRARAHGTQRRRLDRDQRLGGACCSSPRCVARGERGSVVTLICDGGDRYAGTYYSDAWVAEQGLELAPYTEALETFLERGAFPVAGRADLDLGDHALDRVDDLGRNLVHPVGVARVRRGSPRTAPVSSSLRVTHWQPGTTSPHLNCFIGPLLTVGCGDTSPPEGGRRPARRARVRSAHVPDPGLPR